MNNYYLTDKDFLHHLNLNGGIFQLTANSLSKQLGIKMTSLEVETRAIKYFKNELDSIVERHLDLAENALLDLMNCEEPDIRQKAITFFINSRKDAMSN